MQNRDKKAIIIAFEGIDQSGKETQAALLAKRLQDEGKQVVLSGFPDYETPIGMEIRHFLNGDRSYDAATRQLLYVANRYEKKKEIEQYLKTMDYIILDRYKASGLAYGLVNGLDQSWCMELEKGLPDADVVYLFDTPSQESYRRKPEGRDVYEQKLDFLESVRQAYLSLAKQFNWIIFSGDQSLEELSQLVWNITAGK